VPASDHPLRRTMSRPPRFPERGPLFGFGDPTGPQAKPGQTEVIEWDDKAHVYRVVAIHDDQPATTSGRKPQRDWLASHRIP
jgi:hypothetical protein